MSGFQHFVFKGDAKQRGLAHGYQLKERIHKTFDFYEQAIFLNSSLSPGQIKMRAEQVASLTTDFQPEFVTEIEAIAEAAEIESWKIFALNARTEILNAPVAECTSLFFQHTTLLGQTWDWIRELEELVVIARYDYDDGRTITTLTEPGMLAKIGLNSAGLGVCVNFLVSSHEMDGVPVHILLRAILESATIAEARQKIERSGRGKSSHFLVADNNGACFGMEFAAGNCSELGLTDGVLVHTNHCIGQDIESTMIPTSAERLAQARQHLSALDSYTIEDMQTVLLDDSQGNESIQSSYHAEEVLGGLDVGSCATIIMDLQQRKFYARKGPGTGRNFQCFA